MGLSINGEVFTVWLERLVQLKKNSGMTIEQIATASLNRWRTFRFLTVMKAIDR